MRQVLIRYKTKPESAQENERLIKAVFAELEATSPPGVRYMVFKLDDGTFVHVSATEEGGTRLPSLEVFQAFQKDVEDRCVVMPLQREATLVGNYGMLAERKA
jgi:hypothetical protein